MSFLQRATRERKENGLDLFFFQRARKGEGEGERREDGDVTVASGHGVSEFLVRRTAMTTSSLSPTFSPGRGGEIWEKSKLLYFSHIYTG